MDAGLPSDTTLSAEYRVLRAAPKSPKPMVTVFDARVLVLKDETATMMALATKLGYAVNPQADLERELANSIVARMLVVLVSGA